MKKEVAKVKEKAYEELYEKLDIKEGEKDLYQLARQRETEIGGMCSMLK